MAVDSLQLRDYWVAERGSRHGKDSNFVQEEFQNRAGSRRCRSSAFQGRRKGEAGSEEQDFVIESSSEACGKSRYKAVLCNQGKVQRCQVVFIDVAKNPRKSIGQIIVDHRESRKGHQGHGYRRSWCGVDGCAGPHSG